MIEPEDTRPANPDEAEKRLRRPHQEPAAGTFQTDPVVADKPREDKASTAPRFDEIERQSRFARPGRPADQDRARADEHGRGMNRRSMDGRCGHYMAGRRTMKRAPSTLRSPRGSLLWPGVPRRFSTQIVPPCASTICLEIERPSPE